MEQRINHVRVDLHHMSDDSLVEMRHHCERRITQCINDVNKINVELNTRLGRTALPEFGQPMTSFDHDTFGDFPPPNLDYQRLP